MAFKTASLVLLVFAQVLLASEIKFDDKFNMEWSVVSSRMYQPKCVDIPANMSLCHNIGYTNMRLPNLLEHDNLEEVTTQATNWNALIGIRCHPDTQVFLCSLFSPVCLERVVYPCRSLCEDVQTGCEGYMKRYGFPWPEMFRCDKFPTDDELCIPAPSGESQQFDDRVCKPCADADTYEGILHKYCSNNFVIRAKIKGLNKRSDAAELGAIEIDMGRGKKKFYKRDPLLSKKVYKELASPDAKIFISQAIGCTCEHRVVPKTNHLISIRVEEKYDRTGQLTTVFYADFITPWSEEGESGTKTSIKKAIRAIKKTEAGLCEGGMSTLNIHQEAEASETASQRRRVRKKHRRA